jgi:hypothetical protein
VSVVGIVNCNGSLSHFPVDRAFSSYTHVYKFAVINNCIYCHRLLTECEESTSVVTNNPGCYSTVCIELNIDGLAVNTLLQSHHVNDIEGNMK